jgi:nucleotide-binding universal stress UspA family protein
MLPWEIMPEPSQVVVAYDFSHSGHAALERAIAVATRAPWHVLHIVCAIDPRMPFPALPTDHVDIDYADRVQRAVSDEVAAELGSMEVPAQVNFFVHARIGKKAAKEILEVAEDVGADLIIVGSKGLTGLERAMLGSTSERVVREAGCTVEVARPKRYPFVPLLEVTDAEPHHSHYVPPHRYSYEENRVIRRPDEWPLY